MNTNFRRLWVSLVALALTAAVWAGESLQIKLKDGSTWRGQVADSIEIRFLEQGVEVVMQGKITKAGELYIVVDGKIGGIAKQKTLFKIDIVSIKTLETNSGSVTAEHVTPTGKPEVVASTESSPEKVANPDAKPLGVFVLPLEGNVGETFRNDEITKLGDYLDKNHGPGQIIVLLIESNGGASAEAERIYHTITKLKSRHRVVAWVKKAISAGCETAMCCDEIYFTTDGTAGSATTWSPATGQSVQGELLDKILEQFGELAEASGYSRYIAHAMKVNSAICTYDKDPETGKVTFYNDMSGKYVLSGPDENLCFNASNALHCGFSKGTADTPKELARFLNLPEWKELGDYGRKLASEWQRTCKQAEEEIPRLVARYERGGIGPLSAEEAIGAQIRILTELINWYKRCTPIAQKFIPPPNELERNLAELRRRLAQMNKQR